MLETDARNPGGSISPTRPRAGEDADRLRSAIGRLSRDLRPTVAGSSLTPSQISVLFTIVRHQTIGLSELSDLERLNPTMLSRVTAQLCELGLIRRESTPRDRRTVRVSATAAGRKMRERIHRERTRALDRYISQLDEDHRERLRQAIPVLEELSIRIREGGR